VGVGIKSVGAMMTKTFFILENTTFFLGGGAQIDVS